MGATSGPHDQRDVTLSRDPHPTSHVYTGLLLRAQTHPLSEPHLLLLGLPMGKKRKGKCASSPGRLAKAWIAALIEGVPVPCVPFLSLVHVNVRGRDVLLTPFSPHISRSKETHKAERSPREIKW